MTSLAAIACLVPEKYNVATVGIDELAKAVSATCSTVGQQAESGHVADAQQTKNAAVMLNNPPKANHKGRPKEKVERLKSIVIQEKEKAMKKKGKATKKKGKKIPPCSYCNEDGHGVQDCEYMVKAEALSRELKQTELKL